MQPLNTALAYFADEGLRDRYCQKAFEIMQNSTGARDPLIYMVFAEQRLLAMLAREGLTPERLLREARQHRQNRENGLRFRAV